jgi:DNA-binding IclR family transcriptional regulator
MRANAGRALELKAAAEPKSSAPSLVPAIDRAIALLALLDSAPQQAFSLAEITRQLAIPKSTAMNICNAMVAGQLLRRSQDGYQLGRRLVQLGSAYVSSIDIVREFYEVSRAADVDLGAMIQLAVLDEDLNAVYLARQDCASGFRLGLRAEIGRRVPANCTAAGKALLAALPPDEFERRLNGRKALPGLTRNSVTSPTKLEKELALVRRRGFATEDEEILPGVCCIARAATTNHREDGLVAISLTMQKQAHTPARRKRMQSTLSELVDTLEKRL